MRVIKHQLTSQGLDQGAIDLAMRSVSNSTKAVYDAKWEIFRLWCREQGVMATRASVGQISNFLSYLATTKGRAPSTLDGYRAAIASVYRHIGRAADIDHPILTQICKGVRVSRPPIPQVPKWNLPLVLWSLSRPPYEPLDTCDFDHLTYKTVFLVLLGTACRRSELHALDRTRLQHHTGWEWVDLLPTPGFKAKFQARGHDPDRDRHWHLKALPSGATSAKDRAKCPVRALRQYLKRSDRKRRGTTKLFIPIANDKDDITANTITSWVKKVILQAYRSATPEVLKRFGVSQTEPNLFRPAHEIRALGPSYSFASSHPTLQDVLRSGYWKQPNTFIRHYLKDVQVASNDGLYKLAEHVLPGAPSTSNTA